MYLIIGANGFLGSYLIKAVLEKTKDSVLAVARNIDAVPDFDAARVSWRSCDISDFSAVNELSGYLDSLAGKVKIIYLAAIHNPDSVEKDPRAAWHTNITSLSYFLNQIQNVECFFYPSTDSVYGNSVDHYHFEEGDPLNPVNRYGRHKALAERLVLEYGYCVVRYPFLIAPSLLKYKKHFYDLIVSDLLAGRPVKMFSDSFRSTLDFGQAAGLLIELAEKPGRSVPKVLNVCGDMDYSKYEIGLMIADKLKVSRSLIQPISMQTDHDVFQTERAVSTLMDNTKAKKVLGLKKIEIRL